MRHVVDEVVFDDVQLALTENYHERVDRQHTDQYGENDARHHQPQRFGDVVGMLGEVDGQVVGLGVDVVGKQAFLILHFHRRRLVVAGRAIDYLALRVDYRELEFLADSALLEVLHQRGVEALPVDALLDRHVLEYRAHQRFVLLLDAVLQLGPDGNHGAGQRVPMVGREQCVAVHGRHQRVLPVGVDAVSAVDVDVERDVVVHAGRLRTHVLRLAARELVLHLALEVRRQFLLGQFEMRLDYR